MISIRFRLRTLLFAMAALSIMVASLSQIGMADGQFEFVDSELQQDAQGRWQGKISWQFCTDQAPDRPPAILVCSVSDLQLSANGHRQLLANQPGDVNTVRYRSMELGPLKKQDPFKYHLTRHLGVRENQIVGYVWFDGWLEVVINGKL